jgi:hypothetical protein
MTLDEMKAAVAIAEDQKTYVAAHAYRDDAVNRAIDAGVKVIDHNFLVSEETIMRMAKEGIILSLQGYMAGVAFAHPEQVPWYNARADSQGEGSAHRRPADGRVGEKTRCFYHQRLRYVCRTVAYREEEHHDRGGAVQVHSLRGASPVE